MVVDNNRWRRTRLIEARSIAQTITIAFHWPSDAADPHTYLMIVDAANWSVDHRLTSSVIWAKLNEIQSIPDWTTNQTVRVSDRLSIMTPFAAPPATN